MRAGSATTTIHARTRGLNTPSTPCGSPATHRCPLPRRQLRHRLMQPHSQLRRPLRHLAAEHPELGKLLAPLNPRSGALASCVDWPHGVFFVDARSGRTGKAIGPTRRPLGGGRGLGDDPSPQPRNRAGVAMPPTSGTRKWLQVASAAPACVVRFPAESGSTLLTGEPGPVDQPDARRQADLATSMRPGATTGADFSDGALRFFAVEWLAERVGNAAIVDYLRHLECGHHRDCRAAFETAFGMIAGEVHAVFEEVRAVLGSEVMSSPVVAPHRAMTFVSIFGRCRNCWRSLLWEQWERGGRLDSSRRLEQTRAVTFRGWRRYKHRQPQ